MVITSHFSLIPVHFEDGVRIWAEFRMKVSRRFPTWNTGVAQSSYLYSFNFFSLKILISFTFSYREVRSNFGGPDEESECLINYSLLTGVRFQVKTSILTKAGFPHLETWCNIILPTLLPLALDNSAKLWLVKISIVIS